MFSVDVKQTQPPKQIRKLHLAHKDIDVYGPPRTPPCAPSTPTPAPG